MPLPSPHPAGGRPALRRRRVRLLVAGLLLLAGLSLAAAVIGLARADAPAAAAKPDAAGLAASVRQPLIIATGKGRFLFTVEVVASREGLERGLMGRTTLAADEGMLFDYGAPRQVTMWMKNTPLPLDMIFVAADGRVVRVAERTQPYSEDLIPSFQPVAAVLEVAAGTAAKLGIVPGSRLEHPVFNRAGR